MRDLTIGGRWLRPREKYSGPWHLNPWINAASGGAQVAHAVPGGTKVSASADSHTDPERVGTTRTPADEPEAGATGQQKVAIRIWENEGGSIGAHTSVRS